MANNNNVRVTNNSCTDLIFRLFFDFVGRGGGAVIKKWPERDKHSARTPPLDGRVASGRKKKQNKTSKNDRERTCGYTQG